MPIWPIALTVAAALWTTLCTPLTAQTAPTIQLADAGPRFLSIPSPGAPAVDVSRSPILQRRVTIDVTNATRADALAAIGQQAGLRFVLNLSLPQADERVSMHVRDISVAAALTELLLGAGLDVQVSPNGAASVVPRLDRAPRPVARRMVANVSGRVVDATTGAGLKDATVAVDQTAVVTRTDKDGGYHLAKVPTGERRLTARLLGYAPFSTTVTLGDRDVVVNFSLHPTPTPLNTVVVSGTIAPTRVRELPNPITVVTSDEIQQLGVTQIAQLFRGEVPGVASVDDGLRTDQEGVSLYIRGSATLDDTNGNTIKTYVDGVEIADSKFLNSIDPRSIDHIEILRGPEASTLYGAGALNGVMQIFTKKGGFAQAPELTTTVSAGTLESKVASAQPQYDATASLAGGGAASSYNLGGSYNYAGPWMPGYHRRTWAGTGTLRQVLGPVTAVVSVRASDVTTSNPDIPFFADHVLDGQFGYQASLITPTREPSSLTTVAGGLALTYAPMPHWTHQLAIGIDRLDVAVNQTGPALTTNADTLLVYSSQETHRFTLNYNETVDIRPAPGVTVTTTAGAEYSNTGVTSIFAQSAQNFGALYQPFVQRQPDHSTGFFGQAKVGFGNAVFLTGGLRGEANPNFGARYGIAWSPRAGISAAHDVAGASVKVRASYGTAILAPDPGDKLAYTQSVYGYSYVQLANPNLGPQRQRGFDTGADVYLGSRFALSATYFSQDALGMINDETLSTFVSRFDNIGRVHNSGVELEGNAALGLGLSLQGAYTIQDSHIRALDSTYQGFYHVGDRLWSFPRTVGAVTLRYADPARSVSVTAEERGSFVLSNDSLSADKSDGRLSQSNLPLIGVTFPGGWRFNIRASQQITHHLGVFAQVNNVANVTILEYRNYYPIIGRSTLFGCTVRQ